MSTKATTTKLIFSWCSPWKEDWTRDLFSWRLSIATFFLFCRNSPTMYTKYVHLHIPNIYGILSCTSYSFVFKQVYFLLEGTTVRQGPHKPFGPLGWPSGRCSCWDRGPLGSRSHWKGHINTRQCLGGKQDKYSWVKKSPGPRCRYQTHKLWGKAGAHIQHANMFASG